MNFSGVYAFSSQGMGRTLSGCKVPLGDARDHLAVTLFREWVLQIMGAQACLNVAKRHLGMKGRQRRAKHSGGIALGQHSVGLFGLNDAF